MYYSPNMNPQYGTKWFTFYTKVRPWLGALAVIPTVTDFAQYTSVYMGNAWLFIYFVAAITQAVLNFLVLNKSKGAYNEFVPFVQRVLMFETLNMAYGQGVQRYVQDGLSWDYAAVVFVAVLLVDFLIWYLLNMRYFKKRLMCEPTGEPSFGTSAFIPNVCVTNNQTATISKEVASYGTMTSSYEAQAPRIRFCRKCGTELVSGARFCSKCGTLIENR